VFAFSTQSADASRNDVPASAQCSGVYVPIHTSREQPFLARAGKSHGFCGDKVALTVLNYFRDNVLSENSFQP
jgi:hypothetical protein